MSFFDFIIPKCKICKKFGTNNVITIPYHGIYGQSYEKWYYHAGCLQDALDNPMKYGHEAVDIALEITDRIAEIEKQRQKDELFRENKRNEQLEKIRKLKSSTRG